MNKTLNVLHIASFQGNIGDIANHNGFRKILQQNIPIPIQYDEIEIRQFYKSWNIRKFDEEFADLANKYDLVVIGGGNFFELAWDYSETGTTIDISKHVLDMIKTPILFNGLGVDDGKGVSPETVNKFRDFLEILTSSDQFIVSVRNDGSKEILEKYYDKELVEKVYHIPDGGFFLDVGDVKTPDVKNAKRLLGINVAGDMMNLRFTAEETNSISGEDFIKTFSETLNKLMEQHQDLDIMIFPHMYADYQIMHEVFKHIKDTFIRTRISIAPYFTNNAEFVFGLYRQCDLMLGMRFHSNVCAMAQNIPTIGLISYHKHGKLYEEIGMPDRMVMINRKGFEHNLEELIGDTLKNTEDVKLRYSKLIDSLTNEINNFHNQIANWLKRHNKL